MEKFRAIKFNAIGLNDTNVAAADSTYTSDAAYRTDTPTTTLTASLTTTSTSMTVTLGGGLPDGRALPREDRQRGRPRDRGGRDDDLDDHARDRLHDGRRRTRTARP